ncbi:MAG: superoxide dismutase, partial [Actinobacteria bacterium]|nr:superoxide dismutase [Actinomycetota bacterium]
MSYELPELPYLYDALQPTIDEGTMKIHHDKHHAGYVKKLNAALASYQDLADMSLEELLGNLQDLDVSDADRTAIRQNGGGHANHSLFWEIMGPEKEVDENLVAEIEEEWGSVESFKDEFAEIASGRFGSGWAWLVRNDVGELSVYSTANQDSPLLTGDTPIIGLDVWEHAYYLQYQNERGSYIDAWWKV